MFFISHKNYTSNAVVKALDSQLNKFRSSQKSLSLFIDFFPDLDLHPESRGHSVDRLIYSPDEKISLSLEFCDR